MELVVSTSGVDLCKVSAVVVKSGCGESVDLVELVSQNRAVMAKGAMLVLDMLGPIGLMSELTVLVVHAVVPVTVVGGASVTLRVDSCSTTSGLTVGGAVGGDRGPAVLENSKAVEGKVVGGRIGSSGAVGASDKVV